MKLNIITWMVNSSSLLINFISHAAEADSPSRQKGSGLQPIFKVGVCLAIPNIIMVPGLDEVQQALNRAVDCVVSVSKGVGQWSKERISKVVFFFFLHYIIQR